MYTALIVPSMGGFAAGASLIIAIGAQNAFVLRQGLRREHILAVVTICTLSDAILIVLGIGGVGMLVQSNPLALHVVRWMGAAFLLAYAALAAQRALRSGQMETQGLPRTNLANAVLTALALTWLNPHVYLDTVLLLGSLAAPHGPSGRWFFGAGAILASSVWFTSLGYGARFLNRFFVQPQAWRILDGLIAATMLTLGILLILQPILQ